MIEARRTSRWTRAYELSLDGRPLTTFDRAFWRNAGTFTVDGRRFELRSDLWGSTYRLAEADGTVVASAQRVGRKDWTVQVGDRTHQFRRRSVWRAEEELLVEGQPVGAIRRTSMWSGGAQADLPGLSPEVAVFALAVVLTHWDNAAAAT